MSHMGYRVCNDDEDGEGDERTKLEEGNDKQSPVPWRALSLAVWVRPGHQAGQMQMKGGRDSAVGVRSSLSPYSWTLPSLCPAGVREPQWEHIIVSSFLCILKLRKGLWSWQRGPWKVRLCWYCPRWPPGPQLTPLVRGYWSVSLGSQGSQRSMLSTGFLQILGWLE